MPLHLPKYELESSHFRIVKGEKTDYTRGKFVVVLTALFAVWFAFLIFAEKNDTTNDIQRILHESDIDWNNAPCSPTELNSDWIETTPELMKQNSTRQEFVNKNTGLKVAFDKGTPSAPGYRSKDHWHIYNPWASGVKDYYLD